MKWVLRIVLIVVVLVAVLGGVAFWQMDRIATVGLEKATAFATQCEVEVDKVDLSPFAGKAELQGMEIKNPESFQEVHEYFLNLESGKAEVDLGTLRDDEVVIPEVTIDGVEISLVGRDGKTNYETILESLARLQTTQEDDSGKTFTIKKVSITNVSVWVNMDEDPALGLAPVKFDKPLTLKPIELTDVGSGGVPLSQISADVITNILVQVVAQLGNQLGDRVLSGLTNGLSGVVGGAEALQGRLSDIAGELNLEEIDVGAQLDRAAELGSQVFEGVGEGIGEGIEGLGNLIDGDEEDDNGNSEDQEEDSGGVLDGILGN